MTAVDLGYALMVLGACLGVFLLWTAAIGAGWEPTARRKVRRMLELSGTGPSDVVYDLGSGDGRIIIEAASSFGARAVGVEADPLRVLYSRLSVSAHSLKGRVRVVWGNFFHVSLADATVVTLFLSQGANRKLRSKLLAELKPGTRVVSYVWTFDGWTPASRDAKNELALYVVPDRPPSGDVS
jgi:precorrin-6B methylase 2